MLASIRVAIDFRLHHVIFEGDCMASHNGNLSHFEEVDWRVKRVLLDCQHLLQRIDMWELALVPREANSAAHNLAFWCSEENIQGIIAISVIPHHIWCHDLL